MEQPSLLTGIEFNPVLASPGKRFLNYVIDTICIYILVFVIFYILGFTGVITIDDETQQLPTQLFAFSFYVIYFSLSEIIFNGRTIGKLITGTRVINIDGTETEPKTFFLRALSRLIPFEPFSALGNPSRPWHDKWTKTYVIDVKKTTANDSSFY